MLLKTNIILIGISNILIIIRNIDSTPEQVSFVNSDVSQSKTIFKFEANLAIDGNLETCSIAEENKESNQPPWWRVVFDKAYNIENLVIYFATDQSVRQTSMINNAKIFVSPNNQQTEEYLCHKFSTTRPYVRVKCEKTLHGHVIVILNDSRFYDNLKLCEVQFNVDLKKLNIALGRPTFYTFAPKSTAEYVVDGNIKTCDVVQSSVKDLVWWSVRLDESYYISNVIICFQRDPVEESTSIFVNLYVSNNEDSFKDYLCGFTESPNNKLDINNSIVVKCKRPVLGMYVTIQKYAGLRTWLMILCEVQIFFEEDISDIQGLTHFRVSLVDSITSQNQFNSSHNSKMATDGNPDTCSISEEFRNGDHPWWRLELDTFYDVSELIITSHETYLYFMNSLNIYISKNSEDFEENLCASFQGSPNIFFAKYIEIICKKPIFGKFITITRTAGFRKALLVLCEIYVKADRKSLNLAFKKSTYNTGTVLNTESIFAVDGNITTCAVIGGFQNNVAWWRVILDNSYYVTDVNMHFWRNLTGKDNYDINVYVSNDENYYEEHTCGYYSYSGDKADIGTSINITCNRPTFGIYVTIKKHGTLRRKLLILCEVEVLSKEDSRGMTKAEVSVECSSHEYKCHEGPCIPKDWLCDGTHDCRLGDDEAPSCKMKCEEGKFKCKKRNLCIETKAVCDGKVDCHDYSDELSCLKPHTGLEFITATFNGETNFYICSQGWKIEYSIDLCEQHASFHLATSYEALGNRTKFLSIKDEHFDSVSSFAKLFKARCE